MENNIDRRSIVLLTACLFLGVVAQMLFFQRDLGVNVFITVTVFYLIFFMNFRHCPLAEKRMGILLLGVILMIAFNYTLYDFALMQALNILVLPMLIFAHVVLITKPKTFEWHHPYLLTWMAQTAGGILKENRRYIDGLNEKIGKQMDRDKYEAMKKVVIGLLVGAPILMIVLLLLMQADAVFQNLLGKIPVLFSNFEEIVGRIVVALLVSGTVFGLFQSLQRPSTPHLPEQVRPQMDGIIALTILVLLNSVYLLFIFVQFTYFFGGELQNGLSYSEYARRGFFELLAVTLVNLSVLLPMLLFQKVEGLYIQRVLKALYALLIVFSMILLVSAFQRLLLYESQYGYTMDRLLAMMFMIFLFVLFTYTLIKVWIPRLPLIHFYIICAFIFYTCMNGFNLESWVVEKNLERYDRTGDVDMAYLNSLSYTGVSALLDLYEEGFEHPHLEFILQKRYDQWVVNEENSWVSYNYQKNKVEQRLREWGQTP
ncbi:protein of unknown function [Halobacillus karajensis]|uniref:Uncharacterized protein n=1 Tax=Halobacillus karajensis TaxID=195088 RepID=A0A024P9G0_9BACI|nr:DUF4173 domain-containing protein [Halobacillus karajensis]CDQ21559.1 hypothetical protein BN982_03961 [Halobacillus karajensis]CDQ25493.1 hypothetical protein BN983_03839 [Halobacillus karajensis]CDQ28976.1 hypothetical protein BN981_03320 [Halobacillus karajensis]SEI08975.1 protein of unknown function [Halobacillus karajensis]